MTTRYPFTAAGFKALQKELYALPQDKLQAEANDIRFNFINWMNARFLLKASQSIYLENLSEPTIAFAASSTAQAVEHRLPVTLHKGKKPPRDENKPTGLAPEKEIFKILEVKNKLNITEGEEGPEPDGEVIIDIDYIIP